MIPAANSPTLPDLSGKEGTILPAVNVDVRGMQVKVQISDDVERVVSKVLREAVAGDLKAMERRLDEKLARSGIPTGQSVVE